MTGYPRRGAVLTVGASSRSSPPRWGPLRKPWLCWRPCAGHDSVETPGTLGKRHLSTSHNAPWQTLCPAKSPAATKVCTAHTMLGCNMVERGTKHGNACHQKHLGQLRPVASSALHGSWFYMPKQARGSGIKESFPEGDAVAKLCLCSCSMMC